MQVHFGEKNDLSFHFWLIFNKAPSENVVAMATRNDLALLFWLQNITYIFLGKVTKYQVKTFCWFGVMLQKPRRG